jgi:hypothetical protein
MPLLRSLAIAVFVAASTAAAQPASAPKSATKPEMKHEASPWKEMNAFHEVLGATFHPVAAGNFAPLREKAPDLNGKAREWAASTAPAACATEKISTDVAAISSQALVVSNLVLAKASDDDLRKAITELHDKFESVEKACGGHGGMKHTGHY